MSFSAFNFAPGISAAIDDAGYHKMIPLIEKALGKKNVRQNLASDPGAPGMRGTTGKEMFMAVRNKYSFEKRQKKESGLNLFGVVWPSGEILAHLMSVLPGETRQ